jgi:hypothetical protein
MGAGAIYATVGDLGKWIGNHISPRVGNAELIRQMMTPLELSNGDPTGYGLGLFIDEQRGLTRVHHGGADAAHRSQLAYYPEIQAGITTQSNHADFDRSIPFRLAAAFFADAMEPEKEERQGETSTTDFDPGTYDPEGFDEFVGRYALEAQPSFVITFSRDGDTLLSQAVGQPQVELTARSTTSFKVVGVEATLEFQRNDEGEVDSVILNQGGRRMRAMRLSSDDVWEPDAVALKEFTGRYFSAELETFYTLGLEEGTLVVEHRRLETLSLKPGAEDRFTGGNLELSFERDRNGRILGFYLSNGRTRDVRFARLR